MATLIPGYPDTVRHCIVGGEQPTRSWCGVDVGRQKGHFIGAQHALLSKGVELKLCPDCAEAMKVAVDKVAFQQKSMSAMDRPDRPDREPHPKGIPYKPQPGPSFGVTERPPATLDQFGVDG
jgi:hypothetical protein